MTEAILFVAVLLLIGTGLRVRFRLFRWLYIPASVIAGLLGLLTVQAGLFVGSPATETTIADWVATLEDWPSFLIAVVFAGMLLERKPSPIKDSLSQVGRQGLMVWIIVLGQTAVGLLATWLLIQPFYDVPNSLGMLIETGFAGGHGTAAAMGKVYASEGIQFESGRDLGVLMATGGLIYGIVTGILWINVGVRLGWVNPVESSSTANQQDIEPTETPIGYAKVGSETIDPLLLQLVWLILAVGVGMAMQSGVSLVADVIDSAGAMEIKPGEAEQELSRRLSAANVLDFPLFIYTLFGGLVVRQSLRLIGRENAIDRETINRLTATAMDVLVVAAVATLNLSAVAMLLVPFSILFVCGAIWSGICLLLLARWILPHAYWFHLGLINYGMSTGTTATGFVLLRVVDPELESGAAEDYALAAPLSSPFIGGGMLTVALPLLLLERVSIAGPAIVITAIVAVMIFVGVRWNRSVQRHSLARGHDPQST